MKYREIPEVLGDEVRVIRNEVSMRKEMREISVIVDEIVVVEGDGIAGGRNRLQVSGRRNQPGVIYESGNYKRGHTESEQQQHCPQPLH